KSLRSVLEAERINELCKVAQERGCFTELTKFRERFYESVRPALSAWTQKALPGPTALCAEDAIYTTLTLMHGLAIAGDAYGVDHLIPLAETFSEAIPIGRTKDDTSWIVLAA